MAKALGGYPSQLAVIYIDSKVDSGSIDLAGAENAVIALLDANTFANGFKGQVVINTPATAQLAHTQAAINASPNQLQYYFTIDGEMGDFLTVAKALVPLTKNRGSSASISTYLSGSYDDAIKLPALNGKNGVMSLPGFRPWISNHP